MKHIRVILGLWLVVAITGCSILPNLPTIPPGWTITPSISPTPEATFTPTITPTPLPTARVEVGDRAFFNGDYETALLHYQTAFQDSPDVLVQAAAKWGQARVYFADERYNEVLTAIQNTDHRISAVGAFGAGLLYTGSSKLPSKQLSIRR